MFRPPNDTTRSRCSRHSARCGKTFRQKHTAIQAENEVAYTKVYFDNGPQTHQRAGRSPANSLATKQHKNGCWDIFSLIILLIKPGSRCQVSPQRSEEHLPRATGIVWWPGTCGLPAYSTLGSWPVIKTFFGFAASFFGLDGRVSVEIFTTTRWVAPSSSWQCHLVAKAPTN